MYGKGGRGWRGAVAVVLVASAVLAGCSSGGGANGGGEDGDSGAGPAPRDSGAAVGQRPKDHDPYWVNPRGKAAGALAAYRADGKEREARLLARIAREPVGQWLTPEGAGREARGFTEAAARADRTALLVLYNIPHRDCGQYSGGGAADGNAYRAWIDEVAAGIGDRPAAVVLEPDALLHLVDGCTPGEFHEERYDLLKGAIEKLGALPRTAVYLDAGNPGWQRPEALAEPLRRAGIGAADGFAVNVSNFETTARSLSYGKELSRLAGGKHFVIDTSRNGNGPYRQGDPGERWCNPPGRALGEPPTTRTADPLADAYLWVKRPGESDGTCKGGPKAGEWWGDYALGLAGQP
ncbi:glycoside hydrolase family 6 protein [Streptomyces sp. SPB074]|uniref:glycoside hydrolase family 6 protein n=1 Tax=Streptomyces sp. (strain SPB074) TaxID=465543 RepID=UPI00017F1B32|nr:glycoside hydrolase family 6 protein [Streptomyces sp. SPB074]EDY44454.2 secreted endoglucanase [Streptomyces sp. SPB074]